MNRSDADGDDGEGEIDVPGRDDKPLLSHSGAQPPLDWRRWMVLLSFSLLSLNQCHNWFTFSSAKPEKVRDFLPRLSDDRINLLMNWGPIIYLAVQPLVSWLVQTPGGLAKSFFLGCGLMLASPLCALPVVLLDASARASPSAIIPLHVGQICNAAAGPIVMSLVTRVSVAWFPAGERNRATALAWTANGMGTMVGFILGPQIVRRGDDFPTLIYAHLALSTVPLVLGLVFFREQPAEPPSEAAAEQRARTASGAAPVIAPRVVWRTLCRRPAALIPVVVAGLEGGMQAGWSGVMQQLFEGTFGDTTIGWLGFVSQVCATSGGILAGSLVDWRPMHRRLKLVASTVLLLAAACTLLLIALMPIGRWDDSSGSPDPPGDQQTDGSPPWLDASGAELFVCVCVFCLLQGSCTPLLLEMAAEASYPLPESVSSACVCWEFNLAVLIFLAVPAWALAAYGNIIQGVIFVVSGLLLVAAPEQYVRSDREAAAAAAAADA